MISTIQENIIVPLRKGLEDKKIIKANQDADKLEPPFTTYQFNTYLNIDGAMQPLTKLEAIESKEEEFDYDVKRTLIKKGRMVVDFNVFGKDEHDIEILDIATEIQFWLETEGYLTLKDKGIIVSDIGIVENRDERIIDHYQRRIGFEIEYVFNYKLEEILPAIEEIEWSMNIKK